MSLSHFIGEAEKESKLSPMLKKWGAIMVYRNRIIGRGHNKEKSFAIGGNRGQLVLQE